MEQYFYPIYFLLWCFVLGTLFIGLGFLLISYKKYLSSKSFKEAQTKLMNKKADCKNGSINSKN